MNSLFFRIMFSLCLCVMLAGCQQAGEPISGTDKSAGDMAGTSQYTPVADGAASVPSESGKTVQDEETGNHSSNPVQTENTKPIPENTQQVESRPVEQESQAPAATERSMPVISQITSLESGFSSATFSGDDGFEAFLEQGGASSDAEVTRFLAGQLLANVQLRSDAPGCSTLVVPGVSGGALFGRNFDWQSCDALVVTSKPAAGYASISTVNLGFLSQAGSALGGALEQNDARVMAALYAPLDGMNEKGLAVSVNMIEDRADIDQDTGKPDLTTTTAIRLLLNKAANVDEAIDLLRQYDLHASMGLMVHFAIGDNTGRGVAVEYINNEMVVTEAPVVTNFYLAEGSKHGIGSQQSHERYDILAQTLADHPTMTAEEVRDALDSVSKDNFNEFESTEWSAVFNLNTGEAHYYHRENYNNRYTFSID